MLAREHMAGLAPAFYDVYGNGAVLLLRARLSVEPVWLDDVTSDGHWIGSVNYSKVQTNDPRYTFEVGFGTEHITHSLQTVNRYAPAGKTAPDHNGAINVQPDGTVAGVELPGAASYRFSETHYLPISQVTLAFKGTLLTLAHRSMNDAAFKGLAAGECKFFGARGNIRGSEDYEIEFVFGGNPNQTNLSVGTIGGISKLGWDFLWVEYGETVDATAKAPVRFAKAAHVERISTPKSYLLLGIGP
ncbi:MAG: hypothetical protein GY778_13685 [bacterium]|nr:hypothetical protein [bacterium]